MDKDDKRIEQILVNENMISSKYHLAIDSILNSLPETSINNFGKSKKIITKTLAIFMAGLSVLSVGAYAGNKIYENYKQELVNVKTEDRWSTMPSKIEEHYESLDMKKAICLFDELTEKNEDINIPEVYYKKICTYHDYINMKNSINNIVDMQERDFENNYLLIIGIKSEMIDGLKIIDISLENKDMIIDLGDNDGSGERFDSISTTIVDKSIDAENVIVRIIPGTEMSRKYGYTPMSELNADNIDKLIVEENWVVLKHDDKEEVLTEIAKMDAFIQKEESKMIRVVNKYDDMNGAVYDINDIFCVNGKWLFYRMIKEFETNTITEIRVIKDKYQLQRNETVWEGDSLNNYKTVNICYDALMSHHLYNENDEEVLRMKAIWLWFWYKE